MFRSPRSSAMSAAFSLVEVALALGIFSFGVMGIVGLIPVAVTTHKEAKVNTVLSQIQQRITAEILLTDGASLGGLDGVQRNFDFEGREITQGQVAYSAKIVLNGAALPGGSVSSSLRRVVVIARPNPTGGAISASEDATASLLVAKADS